MAVRRVNESVLGAVERPVLHWTASRLPSWLLPNHLTAIGLTGALLAGAGLLLSNLAISWLWMSSAGLVANWFGDSLDGTLARLRGIERPRFGFFVDHSCDLFSQLFVFLCLGGSPCAHLITACFGLIAFLIAFVYTLIGAHVNGTMRITYFGFGPTEIRALLFAGNLLVLGFGVVDLRAWLGIHIATPISAHDFVITAFALVGVLLLAALSIKEASALSVRDPMPQRKAASPTQTTSGGGQ